MEFGDLIATFFLITGRTIYNSIYTWTAISDLVRDLLIYLTRKESSILNRVARELKSCIDLKTRAARTRLISWELFATFDRRRDKYNIF